MTGKVSKRFGVVLAGAGQFDGSEIQEAVLLLLAIASNGAQYQCFAPDVEQHHVIDHISGAEMPERRSVLREAARIARGDIKPLSAFRVEDFDALVFPGGYGAAKNLSTYALAGDKCTINPEVKEVIASMHKAQKPIGAMCIAPILIAKSLSMGTITFGAECDAAQDARTLGATTVTAEKHDVAHDQANRLFSTPCYMLDSNIADVSEGAQNMVKAMLASMV